MKCGIKHELGGQVCIREAGHEDLCRSRAVANHVDGSITYSEWTSKDGRFHRHCGYTTIYSKNAKRAEVDR